MTQCKYIKRVLTIAVFAGIFAYAGSAVAATPTSEQTDDRFVSFRELYEVGVIRELPVPTVVEIPLGLRPEILQFAVLDLETNDIVAHYFRQTYESQPVRTSVFNMRGLRLFQLTDSDYETTVDFILEDDDPTSTVLTITTEKPVTSSQIRLGLAKNVASPTSVKVVANEATLVAPRRMSGSAIGFPETVASKWQVTLWHSQPLRLSELTLVQDSVEKTMTQGVRFLAQPDHRYRLYADPDRSVSLSTREGGDLLNDAEVLVLANILKESNPTYQAADGDNDGVPDTIDNCVSIANTDQLDINDNRRGDACDDFDRDGVINSRDNCMDDPNRRQEDEDGDGVGDVCDGEESRFTEKYTWVPWVGLATAGLVILGMFMVMIRREDSTAPHEEDREIDQA